MHENSDFHPVGEDGLSEEARLEKYTGPVSYATLLPAIRRDVVLLVDARLKLHEVGMAFVQDQGAQVKAWLDQGLLAKAQLDTFEKREGEEAYTALVVNPFVLVQA